MNSSQELHVVFGAGQIGPLLARRLVEGGKSVRIARRSSAPVDVTGAQLARGDAFDSAFCEQAARGAAVVYHCMNTSYFAKVWEETLPRLQANLIAAAGKAGARLVVLDNLYSIGRTHGRPMNEDTPPRPCSRKGEIRARLAESLWAADKAGLVRVAVGRAADFYGPQGRLSQFGDFFWPRVLQGKSGPVLMRLDTPHTYSFTHDVAAGLCALGADAAALGRTWMLPASPARPSERLVELLGQELGHPIRVQRMPGPLLALASVFWAMGRELKEMGYQWDEPFVLDDARFRAQFPSVAPTSLEEGARQTVEWAKKAYAQ
jgi:nucleoside-diphosphate-sugar epimerase